MRLRFVLLLMLSLAPVVAYGQRADERYVAIYNLIQQGDAYRETEHAVEARAAYEEAQEELLSFQAAFPRWNDKIVKYRLEYIESRLTALAPSLPEASPELTPPGTSSSPTNQLAELHREIQQLRTENVQMQARLKEAFSAQPVMTDPRELEQTRQEALQMQKERDLLLVTLEQTRSGMMTRIDPDVAAREQQILTEVRRQLAEQSRVSARLQTENDELKRRLTERSDDVNLALELQVANALLASLRSTNIALRTDRILMEDRLERARSSGVEGSGVAGSEVAELKSRLAILRARVEIYEAKEVPYTAEELALFDQAPLQATLATDTPAAGARAPEIPPGAGALIAKANVAIQGGRFEEAEDIYRQILRQDPRNVFVLGRLASVQIDLNQYQEAERTLTAVLAIDPRDASSLFGLGMLKFERGDFDEALDALSLSAQISPNDSRSHYYLGKTLLQKGNRRAAETALRRAVQLNPGMSPAHHLLAKVYAAQDPPFTELAQWHYQKAREGNNYPADPELEKKLEDQRAGN